MKGETQVQSLTAVDRTVNEILWACESMVGIPYDGPREHHGQTAARWLEPRVGRRVAWLAEQHVAAKRYLVATDPAYESRLTEVSALEDYRAELSQVVSAQLARS
jgi:hypothetical protein